MSFPHLLSPIQVGTMPLRNRVMMPPHTAPLGPLWGTDEQAAQKRRDALQKSRQEQAAWLRDTVYAAQKASASAQRRICSGPVQLEVRDQKAAVPRLSASMAAAVAASAPLLL